MYDMSYIPFIMQTLKDLLVLLLGLGAFFTLLSVGADIYSKVRNSK